MPEESWQESCRKGAGKRAAGKELLEESWQESCWKRAGKRAARRELARELPEQLAGGQPGESCWRLGANELPRDTYVENCRKIAAWRAA